MDKYQELRAILSGRVTFFNGAYTAASSLWKAGFVGMFGGSETATVRGIRRAVRYYQADSADAGSYAARGIFGKLGRPVHFQSEPEAKACFLRNYLGNPVVLTLEESDRGIRIDAYTARTLLADMNLRYAFRVFEKHLPDNMSVVFSPDGGQKPDVPKTRESRKERKTRKKAEKLEKKAQRVNAKAQAAADAWHRSGKDSEQ